MTTTGLHVYLGRSGITASRARLLERAGVRGVVACAEAVDGWVAPSERAREWGRIARGEGLELRIYSFPGLARARVPRAVAGDLLRVCRASEALGPIPDVEAPYARRGALLVALLDAVWELATPSERVAMGITTLGLPSAPGAWPWPSLITWLLAHAGVELWWQCYLRAREDRRVDAGMRELVGLLGERVVPHIRAYETTPEDLVADLDRACARDGRVDVTAAAIWSDASLEAAELAALRGWTQRLVW